MKPSPRNFRVPMATVERKPTADELYLQALNAKHECLIAYLQSNVTNQALEECRYDFDAAIAHYKRLVKEGR